MFHFFVTNFSVHGFSCFLPRAVAVGWLASAARARNFGPEAVFTLPQ